MLIPSACWSVYISGNVSKVTGRSTHLWLNTYRYLDLDTSVNAVATSELEAFAPSSPTWRIKNYKIELSRPVLHEDISPQLTRLDIWYQGVFHHECLLGSIRLSISHYNFGFRPIFLTSEPGVCYFSFTCLPVLVIYHLRPFPYFQFCFQPLCLGHWNELYLEHPTLESSSLKHIPLFWSNVCLCIFPDMNSSSVWPAIRAGLAAGHSHDIHTVNEWT